MVSILRDGRAPVDLAALQMRKMRIGKAYVDGALSETDYSKRLQEIDGQLRQLQSPVDDAINSAAELFRNVGRLWDEATLSERERLVAPLIDRVFIDIGSKQIAAIAPAPGFKQLIDNAVQQAPDARCVIVGPNEVSQTDDGSVWWRRGRVELPVQKVFQKASTSVSGDLFSP